MSKQLLFWLEPLINWIRHHQSFFFFPNSHIWHKVNHVHSICHSQLIFISFHLLLQFIILVITFIVNWIIQIYLSSIPFEFIDKFKLFLTYVSYIYTCNTDYWVKFKLKFVLLWDSWIEILVSLKTINNNYEKK
jgi:hypothetical protein